MVNKLWYPWKILHENKNSIEWDWRVLEKIWTLPKFLQVRLLPFAIVTVKLHIDGFCCFFYCAFWKHSVDTTQFKCKLLYFNMNIGCRHIASIQTARLFFTPSRGLEKGRCIGVHFTFIAYYITLRSSYEKQIGLFELQLWPALTKLSNKLPLDSCASTTERTKPYQLHKWTVPFTVLCDSKLIIHNMLLWTSCITDLEKCQKINGEDGALPFVLTHTSYILCMDISCLWIVTA